MLGEQIAQKARELGVNMFSVCTMEKDCFHTWHLIESHTRNNVYSVSKSITSLVIGILTDRGILNPFEDSIIKDLGVTEAAEDWENVRTEHLLAHTTGFGKSFLDIDNEDASAWEEADYMRIVLRQPLVYRPGQKMVYSDANYYILSRIITQRTGRTLQELVREWIWNPLGVSGAAWAVCPLGYAMGATGLFLTVEDMAKIGTMLLQNGKAAGREIVPSWWIKEMVKRRASQDPGGRDGYGLGVWVRTDTTAYMANGMLGQLIYISPENGRVVAWQSCDHGIGMGPLTDFLVQLDQEG